jgi:hypothetical protein
VRLCGLLILVWHFERQTARRLVDDADAIGRRDEIVTLYLEHAGQANNWDLVDLSVHKILGHWLLLPTNLGDKDYKLKVEVVEFDDKTEKEQMTYMAVGEGDVYLLPRDQFVSAASSGSLVPLEEDAELMALFNEAGINLQNGWRRISETGESHLCGIPQSKLPGLEKYALAKDGYLCVIITGGNTENALKFLRILSRDMLAAPESSPDSRSTVAPSK